MTPEDLTPQEAQARYEAEWPALNAAKQNASTPQDRKRARQALSALSDRYKARLALRNLESFEEDESEEITELREALRRAQTEITELREEIATVSRGNEFVCAERDALLIDRDEWKEATIFANQRFKTAEAKLSEVLDDLQFIEREPSIVATEGMPSGMGNEPEILAEYTGFNGHRQWVNVGAWLYPGDCVAFLSEQVQPAQDFTDWFQTTDGEPSYQEAFEAGKRTALQPAQVQVREGCTQYVEAAQPAQGEPDIADIIAGELQISRAHAYDKMRSALASAALLQSNAERVPLTDEQKRVGFQSQEAQWSFKGMTAWQIWLKACDWNETAHGITKGQQ